MLEVCIDSLESALNAIHGGADELEVCSSLAEGGLTPTIGLVQEISHMVNNISLRKPVHKSCSNCSLKDVNKIPKINVMLRCRGGSDFCYDHLEMETMLADLKYLKQIGVNRFVFGALTENRFIDEDKCAKIVTAAKPIPVTFHRAFDLCKNPAESLETVIELGFDRVLTSGQRSSAAEPEAVKLIKELLEYNDRIDIMPGAGVNCSNVMTFVDMGCKIVHSSCKVIRHLPKANDISMGCSDSEELYITDENVVRNMKKLIGNF